MSYYLQRRKGVPELPAWWNVAGTAFHETVREWETRAAGDVVPSADATAERFAHHLAEATAETVLRTGKGPHEWRVGGRSSKEYPNKEDRTWWLDKGPEMVAQYVLAQEGRSAEVYRIDADTLGLEVGFDWVPTGAAFEHYREPVKGFIDQVLYDPRTEQILVRDYKSGSQVPVDRLQLMVYRLALEDCFGVTARSWWGDFWHARKGVATRGWDLSDRGRVEAEVAYRFAAMDTAERLGLYPTNPGNNCSACGVREHCPSMSDKPFATWPSRSLALDAPTSNP